MSRAPITVVFVAFQTGNSANGGTESFAQIVERLEGVRRIVVTDRDSALVERLAARGCQIELVNPSPVPAHEVGEVVTLAARVRRLPNLVAVNARIASIVRESAARVVHCNDISAFWHAVFGARSAGARVVFNVRDMFPATRQYGLKWHAARHLADELLVLSEEMREQLDTRLAPRFHRVPVAGDPARTVAIHSIVDLDRMRPPSPSERAAARRELGIDETTLAIAQVGAFCAKKGQLELLRRVVPLVLEAVPKATFWLYGDLRPEVDGYARACVDQVASMPPTHRSRVSLGGYSDRIERVYHAADIVVLPSGYEGLARAMIEAVSCGVPVVSFDVTSADEVLGAAAGGEGAGVVVPQSDFAALAGALIELAEDPERRAIMGTRGRAVAERLFCPLRQVGRHAALYERLHAGLQPS